MSTAAGRRDQLMRVLGRRPPVGGRRIRVSTRVIAGLLALIVLAVLLAPVIAPYSPTATSSANLLAPSAHHLLGTDQLGRDVFSRTLWGGRTSLLSALLAVAMATVVGTGLGLFAGYAPPAASGLVMRVMDVILGFPALLLALLVLAITGGGTLPEAVAISISFVPVFTRVVYLSTLSLREEGYVTAARVAGVRSRTIMRRHILPGVRSEVVVIATSAFGWAILLGATLSFLGLGVHPPTPDWGADLSSGQSYLVDGWWISVAPGVAITLTVLLVNLLGDQLAGEVQREVPSAGREAQGTLPTLAGMES
jgi:ABC-type dipeptide/oligopeptide/nickel transport system permease subunit